MSDPRPCLACGHPFTPEPGNAVTCSEECSVKHRRRQNLSYVKGSVYADFTLRQLERTDSARSGREFPDDDVPTLDGGLA